MGLHACKDSLIWLGVGDWLDEPPFGFVSLPCLRSSAAIMVARTGSSVVSLACAGLVASGSFQGESERTVSPATREDRTSRKAVMNAVPTLR